NELQRKTPQKDEKRVGRGGKRGKTSGRGTKGQKARSGHRIRPDYREQLKKLPKLRGRGKNGNTSIQDIMLVVNVSVLETAFAPGDAITPKILLDRGVVRARKGTLPMVKILGTGELTKKFVVSGCTVSASAKEKIEKAGGTVAA
ncbi:MAG: ribosomal protein large subunit ribosomal protein, partial [Candidatus Adlerbacteria bacterium]|nr:ribosomal protein large subunit ribosomal protein [Candidatus Adlerbacteria bacterium]